MQQVYSRLSSVSFHVEQNINTGLCECPLDSIWANGDKKLCIKRTACNSFLNNIVDGVCIPKLCASGTVLLTSASDKALVGSFFPSVKLLMLGD